MAKSRGHAFLSYVHEDKAAVDEIEEALVEAGIAVWRDTKDLWPGDDWRARIRDAIEQDALIFVACLSTRGARRRQTRQREEILHAIEVARQLAPDDGWFFPVRLDDCDIPRYDLGGGRTLRSVHWVDLFGPNKSEAMARFVAAVRRCYARQQDCYEDLGRPPTLTERLALHQTLYEVVVDADRLGTPEVLDQTIAAFHLGKELVAEVGDETRDIMTRRTARAAISVAGVHMVAGDWTAAAMWLDDGVEYVLLASAGSDDEDLRAWLTLRAGVANHLDDRELALACAEQFLRRWPDDRRRGFMHVEQGKALLLSADDSDPTGLEAIEAAAECFEEALRALPCEEPAEIDTAFEAAAWLATCEVRLNRRVSALDDAVRLLPRAERPGGVALMAYCVSEYMRYRRRLPRRAARALIAKVLAGPTHEALGLVARCLASVPMFARPGDCKWLAQHITVELHLAFVGAADSATDLEAAALVWAFRTRPHPQVLGAALAEFLDTPVAADEPVRRWPSFDAQVIELLSSGRDADEAATRRAELDVLIETLSGFRTLAADLLVAEALIIEAGMSFPHRLNVETLIENARLRLLGHDDEVAEWLREIAQDFWSACLGRSDE